MPPLSPSNVPAVAAVLSGKALTLEGMDYRGVSVFAATQPVAGTSWHLVAKIDRAEMMLPLNRLIFWVSLVTFVAVSIITVALLLLQRQERRAYHLEIGAKAATALLEGEKRYRQLFHSLVAGFALHEIICDREGKPVDYRFLEVNPAFEKLTGLSAEIIVGRTQLEVMPNSEPYWVERYGLVALTGEPIHFENYSKEIGKYFEVTAYSPQHGQFAVTFHDITERKLMEEALKESEFRWKFAIEGTGDGLWDWNIIDSEVFFSLRWKEMLGFTEDEIGNGLEEWEKRLHPEDKADTLAAVQDYFDGKTPVYASEHRVLCKDGGYKWILDRGMVVSRSEDGKPLRMIGTHADITERKQAEDALRLNSEILKNLAEGIFLIRVSDGMIVFANPRFEDLLGYGSGELIGKPVSIVNAPGVTSPEAVAAEIISELARSGTWAGEVLNIRKDGTPLWCHARVSAFDHFQFGRVWVSVHEDITERKQVEEALARSEAEFRTLTETMPQIVWMTAPDGGNIYFNQNWIDYTGMTPEDSYGAGWITPFHPDDQQRAWHAWQLATSTNGRYELECRLRRADGVYRWWLIRGLPLRDRNGAILKWLGTCTDIENIKQYAAEILQLNATLEARVEERAAQLKAINQELETFTYSVSHDLKAPLRGIDGYSRLLLEDQAANLNEEGKTFLANIRKGTQQMGQLIEDLLAYSRLERRTLQTARIDPRKIVEAILAEFTEETQARHIAISMDIPFIEVSADNDGLGMILRNFVDNAIKFTRDRQKPTIEIGGREEAETCILWVRDNGIGFDMKFQGRIFEIFQRLQRAEDYPGTGIGLAIARKAAQRMNGRAWAESVLGAGATFYVELPK